MRAEAALIKVSPLYNYYRARRRKYYNYAKSRNYITTLNAITTYSIPDPTQKSYTFKIKATPTRTNQIFFNLFNFKSQNGHFFKRLLKDNGFFVDFKESRN